MQVLLVEDDIATRNLLVTLLERRGHELTVCTDGERGWQAYQSGGYSLILLDCLLPDMDGLELCRKIRTAPQGRDSVILMVTDCQPGDLARVLDAGADDYIAKATPRDMLNVRFTIAERLVEHRIEKNLARYEIEHSLSRLNALIEALPDAILFKDGNGRWITVNSAAQQLFQVADLPWQGKNNEELIQFQPHLKGVHLACKASDDAAWQKGCRHDSVETITDKGGNQRLFEVSKIPLFEPNGKRHGLVAIGRDVTESRAALSEIIQAKELAEQANEAKSQFLARMSHELRTPLNAILGFAQILDGSEDDAPLGRERDGIKAITNAGWHLLGIINDLLDLSAIEANRLEMNVKSTDLGGCIRDCLETMAPLAKEKPVNLVYSLINCQGIFVLADRFRLKQVLLNLLANAVKYNHVGGDINVTCERTQAGRIRVLVSDTGIGIPAEDMHTLFEPFSRLHKREYSIEGAGIGLSIAKQLVEMMEGTIGVSSVYGQGSAFWIELKQGSASNRKKARVLDSSGEALGDLAKQITMLYIEDSPSHVDLMARITRDMSGIKLIVAHTASLGLELAYTHRPDIILCDICLPRMDGYELLERLMSDARTSHTPVIAISARAMPAQVERGLRAGFRRYLTKPINVIEFKKAVNELLEDEAPFRDGG